MSLPWENDAERLRYLPAPQDSAFERECVRLLMQFLTNPVALAPKSGQHMKSVWRLSPDDPPPDRAMVLCRRTMKILSEIDESPEKYLAGDSAYIQGVRFMISAVMNLANTIGELSDDIKRMERIISLWPLSAVLTDESMIAHLIAGKDCLPCIFKIGDLIALDYASLVAYSEGKGYAQAQRVVDELAILGLQLRPCVLPDPTKTIAINTVIKDPLILATLEANGITTIEVLLQYTYLELQSLGCSEAQATKIVLSLAKHGHLLHGALVEKLRWKIDILGAQIEDGSMMTF